MVKNIKKILLFINLLYNRDFVTQKQVEDICQINKRTFYRYINSLSDIDIPIYYDPAVKGYRLSNKRTNLMPHFNLNETSLLLISLHRLMQSTNGEYTKQLKTITDKIVANSQIDIEETIESFQKVLDNQSSAKDIPDLINSFLINLSIEHLFPLQVQYQDNNDLLEKKIENPSLKFNNDWSLMDPDKDTLIPIDKITHVKLL